MYGLGCRAYGSRSESVQEREGVRLRFEGLWFRADGLGSTVQGLGLRNRLWALEGEKASEGEREGAM